MSTILAVMCDDCRTLEHQDETDDWEERAEIRESDNGKDYEYTKHRCPDCQ